LGSWAIVSREVKEKKKEKGKPGLYRVLGAGPAERGGKKEAGR